MFSFLDSFSYCCSGNPFQLDTNIQASDAGSGMQCGEVTLSGPRRCSLITMAHLHRQFIIIILLMKLEFHCLQIRSQHLKKKKGKRRKINANPVPPSCRSSCLALPAVTHGVPAVGQAWLWGGGCGGPGRAPGLGSLLEAAAAQHWPSLPSPTPVPRQGHAADHCCTWRARAA